MLDMRMEHTITMENYPRLLILLFDRKNVVAKSFFTYFRLLVNSTEAKFNRKFLNCQLLHQVLTFFNDF